MGTFKRLISAIKQPGKIIMYADYKGWLKKIPDRFYLKLMFWLRIRKKLNLKNPITFNEKLQWLKLNDKQERYNVYVDKYEVRKLVEKTIGSEYLVKLYGVYDSFEEIDFNELPKSFVMKCTHDSGGVVICENKYSFDKASAQQKLNKSLKKNYFFNGREWPYKNIKPRIICEEYLESDVTSELLDYKFMCFNGKVKCSFICSNRNSVDGLKVDFYDLDWNEMDFERYYPKSKMKFTKPQNYCKMIEFSERFAKEIPFIRVDFYEVDGKLYFGELTLYPGSGFESFNPEKYDRILGDWISLPL
ncbi:ATP-grasp fold amidoligase family protein [Paenibacillus sp. NPDC058177]|uniref:ATP-grasp fold amidoligase family protein n=1 Tax=Paenibacillus sp. NPDC058177 TaxID=3346369 RepID=UPI0036D80452